MLAGMKVGGGMAVRRGIATADVPAREAEAEMDPGAPDLEALLAAVGRAGTDVANLIKVAALRHGIYPPIVDIVIGASGPEYPSAR
jgi:hypothetical protein